MIETILVTVGITTIVVAIFKLTNTLIEIWREQ